METILKEIVLISPAVFAWILLVWDKLEKTPNVFQDKFQKRRFWWSMAIITLPQLPTLFLWSIYALAIGFLISCVVLTTILIIMLFDINDEHWITNYFDKDQYK